MCWSLVSLLPRKALLVNRAAGVTARRALASAAACLLLATPLLAQRYTVTNLGTLPGRGSSGAQDINNAGQVVGESQYSAFLWTPSTPNGTTGTMTALNTLGPQQSQAYDINASGQVVGFAGPFGRPFLWTPNTPNGPVGTVVDLGTLNGGPSAARGINDVGQVVGSSGDAIGSGYLGAFLWTPSAPNATTGTMTDLGAVVGGGPAYGINNAGQVVGRAGASLSARAFLWTPYVPNGTTGAVTNLVGLGGPNHRLVGAYAINDAGWVVGYADSSDAHTRAFLWQPFPLPDGQTTIIGNLGGTRAYALGINASGQVVGYSSTFSFVEDRAFLWQNGQLIDLNTLIPANPGWVLKGARAINDAGQIVGWGTPNGLGGNRAFLLTPVTSNPAPSLTSLSPGIVTAGGPALTLTVTGSGFVDGSTIRVNGAPRSTTFVSLTQLTATIEAGDISAPGMAAITVVSPAPGGGTSNALALTIEQPVALAVPLYRLDYENTYFFLTANQSEHDGLVAGGWTSRGATGFVYNAPDAAPGVTPLYRLYNPFVGDHFYTASQDERDAVLGAGFADEGVACYVFAEAENGRKPLLRAYNPSTGQHLYTGDQAEYDALGEEWNKEGVVCYVLEVAP